MLIFFSQNVNEESLKHLGEHIESLQKHRYVNNAPNNLRFYIRDSNSDNRGKKVYN